MGLVAMWLDESGRARQGLDPEFHAGAVLAL
jgi:hypothetical protein